MEVKALVAGPSLFCTHQLFWGSLVLRHDHLKLRLMQVPICSPNQQQNDNYRAAEYSLHRSPFWSAGLGFHSQRSLAMMSYKTWRAVPAEAPRPERSDFCRAWLRVCLERYFRVPVIRVQSQTFLLSAFGLVPLCRLIVTNLLMAGPYI